MVMSDSRPRIAYITAGAAGMYCGSCMHDNTLARALTRLGVDALLIPTYTPIRTDEEDVSVDRIFFGGINVFLEQKLPLFRYLPSVLGRFLDQPWLIRWATSRGIQTSPQQLGALAVSMLRGTHGYQRKEVGKLCHWLEHHVQPQLVNLSNMLIGGCVPALKQQLAVPILVTLQGDDVFLEELPEPYRSQALAEIHRLVDHVDGFVVNSRYYAEFMADYFKIPPDKFHITPLGIDTHDFASLTNPAEISVERAAASNKRPPTIGYLARLAPEKGLHVLVDAFLHLRTLPGMQHARLHVAGWLGTNHGQYAEGLFEKLRAAGLGSAFHYEGAVDRHGKIEFLKQLDVLSVPTVYRDPKGIFVLEALAAGVPVVQPDHGAFPELLAATGGGRTVRPNDPLHLAEVLHELLSDHTARSELAHRGQRTVHERFHADAMARAMLEVYGRFLPSLALTASRTDQRE
jgi:glycosyltransferase involved in cell wall biosynthesis